jgi:predicted small lipoprotein YifL
MSIFTRLALILTFLSISGCGVKGKPQVPIEPPVLGRGQRTLVKKTDTDIIKKKKFKSSEPDWEESDDFGEEKNK